MIKGITVTILDRVQTGEDRFKSPVYEDQEIPVANVLVTPTSAEEIVSELQLYGKRSVYTLCIPKGDVHQWEDRRISFFGQTFRAFGPVTEYIENLVPGPWNKKVKVERIE